MKKEIIKPTILPGFMELLPSEQKKFDEIVKIIDSVYKQNGCLAIDTPIIEKSEVLLAKSAGETEKQVYRFTRGKNDLSLRFDLTVPLSRYVAQHYNELTFPFKRYQIGKVYRGERNQKGRYREFYQCDLDIIGNNKLSIYNDALVISLADKVFKKIGLKDYQFKINNRKILSAVLNSQQIENIDEVMILIDKYDKIGEREFLKELIELIGKEKSEYITDIINISGNSNEVINKLKEKNIDNVEFAKGISELEKVSAFLNSLDVNNFMINLKIIRGLDYYTGTVFETFLIGNEQYGSFCSGGRYDNLAENYSNNSLPGVGISIGLTRLFFVLKEIGFIDSFDNKPKGDYLIIPIDIELDYPLEIYKKMINEGKNVQIYLEEDKLKKKMNYANKIGVENVILIGEEELKSNKMKIKNMITGQEEII
ncbi:MAG: histidine--tRNA ligase [Clostridiaceae bacterium]|nr:histidine--tRNA ligase [Clostridiaceae bacterium]